MLASYCGHTELIDMLLRHMAQMDVQGGDGATALIIAAANDRHTAVQRLLSAGARSNLRTLKGHTALDAATAKGFGFTTLLLRTHEDKLSNRVSSALPEEVCDAVAAADVACVVEWLSCGGSIEARRADGYTLLLLASELGHEKVVQTLLERGAATDVHTGDGSTPMMISAYKGHRVVMRLLLVHQLRKGQPAAFCSPRTQESVGRSGATVKIPEYALEFRNSERWRAPPVTP